MYFFSESDLGAKMYLCIQCVYLGITCFVYHKILTNMILYIYRERLRRVRDRERGGEFHISISMWLIANEFSY